MRVMPCSICGCAKNDHHTEECMSCLAVYHDNYKEYMGEYENNEYVSPWHKFKLDNLKYLEQIYESKRD